MGLGCNGGDLNAGMFGWHPRVGILEWDHKGVIGWDCIEWEL